MATKIAVIAVVSLLSAAPISCVMAQDATSHDPVFACVEAAKHSTNATEAFYNCLGADKAKLTDKLDSLVNSLRNELPPEKRQLLDSSQAAWKASVEAETLLLLQISTYDDGSTDAIVPLSSQNGAYRDRIVHLQRMLDQMHSMDSR